MNADQKQAVAAGIEQAAELSSILWLLINSGAWPDDYCTPAVTRCVQLARCITNAIDKQMGDEAGEASVKAQQLLSLMRTIHRDHLDIVAHGGWWEEGDRLNWLYSLGERLTDECESYLKKAGGAA